LGLRPRSDRHGGKHRHRPAADSSLANRWPPAAIARRSPVR
jgi:hypothetical protein